MSIHAASIHAALLVVSGCAFISAVAGGPLATRSADLRQSRVIALLLSGALTIGNAACLLPDVPRWYSLSVVTLTLTGILWVIAATFAAQRRAQDRAAGRRADARAARTRAAAASTRPADHNGRAERCTQARITSTGTSLRAVAPPAGSDGPSRPALAQTRRERPRLSVVTATLVDPPTTTAATTGPRRQAPATITDLAASPLRRPYAPAERPVVTREQLNEATPVQTHPQALYVARDIRTYAADAYSGRGRGAASRSPQARAAFAAAWRARVSSTYADPGPAAPRWGDTRA